ncbi:UDP-3-O-(3-hydroxymyristoyl)glucosamine N-acyltransferase [Candidatus Riflebacteria bacterium]
MGKLINKVISIEKQYTLRQLASIIGGKVTNKPNLKISGVNSLQGAQKGEISFISSKKFLPTARCSSASALVVSHKINIDSRPLIIVDNPQLAFAKLLDLFQPQEQGEARISEKSIVPDSCKVGKNVNIHPGVVLGEEVTIKDNVVLYPGVIIGRKCVIKNDTIIHPNVVIEDNTRIGARVLIHANSVIGSDGFGFVWDGEKHFKIPQRGTVIIEDDVEIGSNVSIDRGTVGPTIIGKGTKMDNLVHIAHNVIVGRHCLIVAQVGISGSTVLGDNVIFAGQSGAVGHVSVGSNTTICARGVVTSDLEDNSVVSGFPAKPHQEEKKIQIALKKLPELIKTVRKLERLLKNGEESNQMEFED